MNPLFETFTQHGKGVQVSHSILFSVNLIRDSSWCVYLMFSVLVCMTGHWYFKSVRVYTSGH